MKDKAQAAWQWTTGTTKAAANATVAGTCKVAAMTFDVARPVARAVAGKSKDAAGVAVGTAAVQASVVPALNWFGWSSIGPVAGTYASSLMAGYAGAVPAGGVYAAAQSVAMTGAVGLTGPFVVAAGAYGAWKGVQYYRSKP